MRRLKLLLTALLFLLPTLLIGQSPGGVDPASLLKPLADSWATYSGDYTGRRYSTLKQIDRNTVKNLTLGWIGRVNPAIGGGTIVGGEGPEEWVPGTVSVRGAVLMVDGYRYVAMVATLPDFQRRGYAEAVMRHALDRASERFGNQPTVLHATEAGRPIYERMGYATIASHTAYLEKRFLDDH